MFRIAAASMLAINESRIYSNINILRLKGSTRTRELAPSADHRLPELRKQFSISLPTLVPVQLATRPPSSTLLLLLCFQPPFAPCETPTYTHPATHNTTSPINPFPSSPSPSPLARPSNPSPPNPSYYIPALSRQSPLRSHQPPALSALNRRLAGRPPLIIFTLLISLQGYQSLARYFLRSTTLCCFQVPALIFNPHHDQVPPTYLLLRSTSRITKTTCVTRLVCPGITTARRNTTSMLYRAADAPRLL